jgi:hypothetical protein
MDVASPNQTGIPASRARRSEMSISENTKTGKNTGLRNIEAISATAPPTERQLVASAPTTRMSGNPNP